MYIIPSEFLQTLPEDFKKLVESNPKFKYAKFVLLVSDDTYTEVFHNVSRAEANILIDLSKSKVLNGTSNGRGHGAIMD